jgi:hypothetical protein
MTKHELASFICKLFALYVILNALNSGYLVTFGFLTQMITRQSIFPRVSVISPVFFLIPVILPIFLAIILWKFSDTIATYMVGSNATQSTREVGHITPFDLHSIAFSVVGLYTLVQAFRQFPVSLITSWLTKSSIIGYVPLNPSLESQLGMFLIQLALGIWLLFGAPQLVRFLRRHYSWS